MSCIEKFRYKIYKSEGELDSVEVKRPTRIDASDKQGYRGIKYYIIAKKCANDASPVTLG